MPFRDNNVEGGVSPPFFAPIWDIPDGPSRTTVPTTNLIVRCKGTPCVAFRLENFAARHIGWMALGLTGDS